MRRSCGPAGTSSSANRPSGLVRVPRFVPTTDTSALGMGAPLAAAVTRPSTRPPWAAASSAEEAKPRAMTRAPGMQLMRVFLWRPASAEEHTTAARRAAESPAPGRSYLWPGGLSRVAAPPAGPDGNAEADSRVPSSRRNDAPPADRRAPADRRSGTERRNGDRRSTLALVTVERRSGDERRQHAERRATGRRGGQERRGQESAAEHIRNALQLIAEVADARELDDEHRRDLDAALFRLRFALDRLETPVGGTWGGAAGR